jgi:hypothetical protein
MARMPSGQPAQVQDAGELGDPRTGPGQAIGAIDRGPGAGGTARMASWLRESGQEVMGAAAGVSADQHPVPQGPGVPLRLLDHSRTAVSARSKSFTT